MLISILQHSNQQMKNTSYLFQKNERNKNTHAIDLKKKTKSQSKQRLNQIDLTPKKIIEKSISNSKKNRNLMGLELPKNIINDKIKSQKGYSERQFKPSVSPYMRNINKNIKNTHYHSLDERNNKNLYENKKSLLINYLQQKQSPRKTASILKIDKPRNEISKVPKQCKSLKYAFRTRQGSLITNPSKPNQDSYLAKNINQNSFLFAVADGHGAHGHFVSQFIVNNLTKCSTEGMNSSQVNQYFRQLFSKIQRGLQMTNQFNALLSGSTLVTSFIDEQYKITCANVGDSRAILARQIDKKNWEIIHLSEDHKPHLEKQKKRIIKKGGRVHRFKDENGHLIGPERVWLPGQNVQGLAMSRSLGDNVSKPIGVTHQPQIVNLQLEEADRFILMASDGVWQFIKNYEILQLIAPFYKDNKIEQCCDALLKMAYDRWTVEDNSIVDDITFILIFLNKNQ